jgi:hypothetical protein
MQGPPKTWGKQRHCILSAMKLDCQVWMVVPTFCLNSWGFRMGAIKVGMPMRAFAGWIVAAVARADHLFSYKLISK